jgi:hypothetical protein
MAEASRLVLILIPKRALLIPRNEAVFASDLQLLSRRRKVLLSGLLTCILRAVSIILRH